MRPWNGGSYKTGKVFSTSARVALPGAYEYRYDFADDTGPADGVPTTWQSGPTVVGAALEWVGLPDYEGSGVSPRVGDPSSTLFTFSVKYTHPLARAPRIARCLVQKITGSGWRDLKSLKLAQTAGDPATGAVFSGSTQLPNETLRHAFYFEDGPGSVVEGEPADWQPGPLLTGPPRLRWTGQPGFEADGVHPDLAPIRTRFDFQVIYADSAGDPPLIGQLVIRRDGRPYATQDMVASDAGDYRTGKVYATSRVLAEPGTYEYRFLFRDQDGTAVGEPRILHAGPTVTDWDRPVSVAHVTSLAALPTPLGAQIGFTLSSDASVTATVINIAGRPTRTIVRDRWLEAGAQTLVWDRRADTGLLVPPGHYLIRLTVHSQEGGQSTAMATVAVR